jgi:hypothetical protein
MESFRRNLSIFSKIGIFQNGIFQKESFRNESFRSNLPEEIFQKRLYDPTGIIQI